uniref:Multifunctional fusion protein n=5 Tax=Canidae TaxID=9608 RepID=A0A8I3NV07_CANLF
MKANNFSQQLPVFLGARVGRAEAQPCLDVRVCGYLAISSSNSPGLESTITSSCRAMAEGEITTFTALTEKFNLPPGNYMKPKLLYCSNGGHFLRILPDGTVDGTRDRSDQHIQLQLSAESVGEVYIKSTETGQYLAMDTDGLLYGSQTPNEECLFLERLEENHYNTYTSKKHAEKNWFVGLKKNGSCKRGPRTHYGQKAILFLPLPVSSD